MNKYYYINSINGMVAIDTEKCEVRDLLKRCPFNVDYLYLATEDGITEDGTEIKKNDVIFVFYTFLDGEKGRKIIVCKDENINKYYKEYREYIEEQDKKRMLRNSNQCCDCGECCPKAIA